MNLNIKSWKRLLDLDNPNHGLLLPILIYCVDKKGRLVLGKPRPGPETAHLIQHEACKTSPSSSRPQRTPLRHPRIGGAARTNSCLTIDAPPDDFGKGASVHRLHRDDKSQGPWPNPALAVAIPRLDFSFAQLHTNALRRWRG